MHLEAKLPGKEDGTMGCTEAQKMAKSQNDFHKASCILFPVLSTIVGKFEPGAHY